MSSIIHEKVKSLKQLVGEKEQEWKILLENQIESLLKELTDSDENLNLEKLRFQKLKKDFEFNLQLLSERDRDLENYEELFQKLKANDVLHASQISELKIRIDDATTEKGILQREKEEVQQHYQQVKYFSIPLLRLILKEYQLFM